MMKTRKKKTKCKKHEQMGNTTKGGRGDGDGSYDGQEEGAGMEAGRCNLSFVSSPDVIGRDRGRKEEWYGGL